MQHVTVQDPGKEQQPNRMSHMGGVRAPWTPGRGVEKGALLSATWILAISGRKFLKGIIMKRGAKDDFSDSPRRADSKNAVFMFAVLLVPDQSHATCWPGNGLPGEPRPS